MNEAFEPVVGGVSRCACRGAAALLPLLLLAPGLAWLVVFFAIPALNQLYVSLQTGNFEVGYTFDWNWSTYTRRAHPVRRAVPALARLRGDRDGRWRSSSRSRSRTSSRSRRAGGGTSCCC